MTATPDVDIAYTDSRNWDLALMEQRFRWLRAHDPVYWSEKDQLWILTKYRDVEYVSKHQELFTSAFGVRPTLSIKIGLIDEGEPRHTQLRTLINKGFSPRMVRLLEHRFRELTKRAIDAVASEGRCDFVQSISVPLPLWLIASMLGIREEDYQSFHRWSDEMMAVEGNLQDAEAVARAGRAFGEYATYATKIIEERRASPKEDLITILAGAADAGLLQDDTGEPVSEMLHAAGAEHLQSLQNDELIKFCVVLLVAGNETTRNGISGGMQLLIENPAEREKLIRNPALMASAVDEMVRLVSPVHSFSRTATRDVELNGKQIREGQRVLMIYGSANRDEEVYEAADEFRVDRAPQHLGFGIGSHFCMGANLARMEMSVVFSELLRRLPDIRYDGSGPIFKRSALVRTCASMPIRFTPEGKVADAA